MLARLIVAATVITVFAAPAAAHAARHTIERGPHGPSAAPLLVELGLAALIGVVLLVRRPAARALRSALERRSARQSGRRARRTAPHTSP